MRKAQVLVAAAAIVLGMPTLPAFAEDVVMQMNMVTEQDIGAIAISESPMHRSHAGTGDVKGRSLVIHAGGNNYLDLPAAQGGGAARLACGVMQ